MQTRSSPMRCALAAVAFGIATACSAPEDSPRVEGPASASPAGPASSVPALPATPTPGGSLVDRLTGKAWSIVAPPEVAPGSIYVFLPTGSLLMTSCVEPYRVATWRAVDESTLAIEEDPNTRYQATVASVTGTELSLNLALRNETRELTLRELAAPYVCSDLPR